MNRYNRLVAASLAATFVLAVNTFAGPMNVVTPHPISPRIDCFAHAASVTTGCKSSACSTYAWLAPYQGFDQSTTWTCCYENTYNTYFGQFDYACTTTDSHSSSYPYGCCSQTADAPACPNASCPVNPG